VLIGKQTEKMVLVRFQVEWELWWELDNKPLMLYASKELGYILSMPWDFMGGQLSR
jgi:hypothetical protein